MFEPIENECSQFILEAKNLPLIKNLPSNGTDFRKVKARKRKLRSTLDHLMHLTFKKSQRKIISTAVTAYPSSIIHTPNDGCEPFYIFPINGYKMMYASSITNYKNQFDESLKNLMALSNMKFAVSSILELLQDNYEDVKIVSDVLSKQSEILIYNIQYFYAVRMSSIKTYDELIA